MRRAVALDPNNGAYLDSLGWAYFQIGQYEEAREHLERAALLVGDDAVVFEHLGDLYLAAGDRTHLKRSRRDWIAISADHLRIPDCRELGVAGVSGPIPVRKPEIIADRPAHLDLEGKQEIEC